MADAITTHSGATVNVLRPTPASIHIEDIAYSLSRIQRFNGHGAKQYTVAEHCVHASCLSKGVKRESVDRALIALLRDAGEMLVSDVPAPVKQYCTELVRIEQNFLHVLFSHLGLLTAYSDHSVWLRGIDHALCDWEYSVLMKSTRYYVPMHRPPENWRMQFWDADTAYDAFLRRYKMLMEMRKNHLPEDG